MRPRFDTHVHVWGDGVEHAFAPLGDLVPPASTATVDELLDEGAHGLLGVLAIQPSQYGYHHDYLLKAASVRKAGSPEIRIMPLVDPESTPAAEVRRLAELPAVAGVRVVARGSRGVEAFDLAAVAGFWQMADELDLTVGVLLEAERLADLHEVMRAFPSLVVIVDHVGRLDPGSTAQLASLLALAERPGVHIKLSALDALSHELAPHRDMSPIVESVLAEFGVSRCLYGSDWPHRRAFGGYYGAPDALLAAVANRDEPDATVRGLDATAMRVLGFGQEPLSR